MKAIAGGFRKHARTRQTGYAALIYVFVLFGLVIMGIVLAPNLLLKFTTKKRDVEEQRLKRIAEAFDESIQRGLIIPSDTDWSAQVMTFANMDQTEVEQTDASFAADPNITRVYLIDPNLGSTILPYTQTQLGLSGSQTNLAGTAARVMIVSNTKRNLTLPVTSGIPSSSNTFNNIWNWVYDSATKAPPSGWPANWNGNGNFLHVHRVNLANYFHRVTCSNLRYGFSTNTMTNMVIAPTTLQFLRGTPLALAPTSGPLKRLHVVNRDIGFDFSVVTGLLEQNTSGGDRATVQQNKNGSQSFSHGSIGDPPCMIGKIVLHLSRKPITTGINLIVSIGTVMDSGALPGSTVTIPASAITDASSGSTFMTYQIDYGTPVGPLVAGVTYFINLASDGNTSMSFYVETSTSNTYANGSYFDHIGNSNEDAWFQLWSP